MLKPPGHRRYLRTQLKRMAALSAAGDSDGAWECFRLLPVETRAVMALLFYAGRCRSPRDRRDRRLRRQLTEGAPA
jgi:hypothetical protein